MALATLEMLKTVPTLKRQSEPFLELLLRMADQMVKDWLKRDVEQKTYTEYYDGTGSPNIVLRQYPVSSITSLHFDPVGYSGQRAGGFGSQTLLTAGTQYMLHLDSGGVVSNRGIVEAIGGIGIWFPGAYPLVGSMGKLAARRAPFWPVGKGNIKVVYTAGYAPGEVPMSIVAATINIVAFMLANMPAGGILQNESLGAYSYSRYFAPLGSIPMLGSTVQSLALYREVSI